MSLDRADPMRTYLPYSLSSLQCFTAFPLGIRVFTTFHPEKVPSRQLDLPLLYDDTTASAPPEILDGVLDEVTDIALELARANLLTA
jgi:hypothetical protein